MRVDIDELRGYLETARDNLSNAIAVLEDEDSEQSGDASQELRDARSTIDNIIDSLQPTKGDH